MSKHKRILSLDALRGLSVFIMIWLNAPPGDVYPILKHAPWEGLTIADIAFPGFVFSMGVSAAVSNSWHRMTIKKIFVRSILLFIVGIFFNILPAIFMFTFWDNFTSADFYDYTVTHLRYFGILQRLALTYLLGMLIIRILEKNFKILIAAFLLLIVYSLGFHIYAPDDPFNELHNISGTIDLMFDGHIYTPTHDPEGLYGTVASTAQMLFGIYVGQILVADVAPREKIKSFMTLGVTLLIVGAFWNIFDIIAKKIWTSPFVLVTTGIEIFILLGLFYLIDLRMIAKKISQPLCSLGKNPLFFFLASNTGLMLLFAIQIDGIGFWIWLWEHTTKGFVNMEFSALLFCMVWCILWIILADFLSRRNIIIKI